MVLLHEIFASLHHRMMYDDETASTSFLRLTIHFGGLFFPGPLHFHLIFRPPPRQLTYSRAINKGGVPDSREIGIVGAALPSGNTSPSCVKKQDVSNLFKNLHTRQNEIASRFGGKKVIALRKSNERHRSLGIWKKSFPQY